MSADGRYRPEMTFRISSEKKSCFLTDGQILFPYSEKFDVNDLQVWTQLRIRVSVSDYIID
jgi:hypothetical protein